MMAEQTSLPLARMVSVKKPYFWVFVGACLILYAYNHFKASPTSNIQKDELNGYLICMAAFIGLFLNLLTLFIKNFTIQRFLNVVCIGYEVVVILFLSFKVVVG